MFMVYLTKPLEQSSDASFFFFLNSITAKNLFVHCESI